MLFTQTLELVPLYSKISPSDDANEFTLPSEPSDSLIGSDEFDFPSTLIVFSETKAVDLTNKFRKDADAYYYGRGQTEYSVKHCTGSVLDLWSVGCARLE